MLKSTNSWPASAAPLSEVFSNVKVTQKLLDLSFINVGSWVEGKLADRFARSEGEAYVLGNSVGRPQGFMTLPTSTAADFTRPRGTLQYVPSRRRLDHHRRRAQESVLEVASAAPPERQLGHGQRDGERRRQAEVHRDRRIHLA